VQVQRPQVVGEDAEGREVVGWDVEEALDRLGVQVEQQEAVEFLATTELLLLRPEAQVLVTLPGQYQQLLEHISVHRWFLGIESGRAIPYAKAVASWYDRVYMPIVEGIREASLLREFPKRSEADLYLWLIEHLWYLREAGVLHQFDLCRRKLDAREDEVGSE